MRRVRRSRYGRTVAGKLKHELAAEHLALARDDIERGDDRGAVNALFYAAEAAIVSLSERHGIDTKRSHGRKAEAAKELHGRGMLEDDFSVLLRELNQERKDVWYEGEDADFGDRSLEDVADDVEVLVQAAVDAHR